MNAKQVQQYCKVGLVVTKDENDELRTLETGRACRDKQAKARLVT